MELNNGTMANCIAIPCETRWRQTRNNKEDLGDIVATGRRRRVGWEILFIVPMEGVEGVEGQGEHPSGRRHGGATARRSKKSEGFSARY